MHFPFLDRAKIDSMISKKNIQDFVGYSAFACFCLPMHGVHKNYRVRSGCLFDPNLSAGNPIGQATVDVLNMERLIKYSDRFVLPMLFCVFLWRRQPQSWPWFAEMPDFVSSCSVEST